MIFQKKIKSLFFSKMITRLFTQRKIFFFFWLASVVPRTYNVDKICPQIPWPTFEFAQALLVPVLLSVMRRIKLVTRIKAETLFVVGLARHFIVGGHWGKYLAWWLSPFILQKKKMSLFRCADHNDNRPVEESYNLDYSRRTCRTHKF